jgi:hypothetical protein
MKYIKSIILLVIVLLITLTISCERDDICPETTPTTPSLIIRTYDLSNQENKKNVFGLVIQGIDADKTLPDYSVVTTDSIVLPLRTNEESTQYILHSEYTYDNNNTPDDDTDDIIGGNQDIITINYNTEEVYVSRACGYKTVFRNVIITIEPDADNWIKSKQSVNDNQSVEDETAAHFKIFH